MLPMKTHKVKSLMKQLLRHYKGNYEGVASLLNISSAYVRMLAKGQKRASYALRELIVREINNRNLP